MIETSRLSTSAPASSATTPSVPGARGEPAALAAWTTEDAPLVPGGDLFQVGRAAAAEARRRTEGRGLFSRCRQLLATGAWKGPRDAADAYVEEADLVALGGLEAARALGVRTVVASDGDGVLRAAAAAGLRLLVRLPYEADEALARRAARFERLTQLLAEGLAVDGVVPTPVGEPFGLDSLAVFAACRLRLPVAHVVADFARLGHRLAQMALTVGADELFGPIMPERALRLGANANNPVMTRKEAAMLLRGAGLTPHERLFGGGIEEFGA